MPLYEYICEECSTRYEKLVRSNGEAVACPKCGSERKTLQLSVFRTTKSNRGSNGPSYSGGGCGCTPSSCGCE